MDREPEYRDVFGRFPFPSSGSTFPVSCVLSSRGFYLDLDVYLARSLETLRAKRAYSV